MNKKKKKLSKKERAARNKIGGKALLKKRSRDHFVKLGKLSWKKRKLLYEAKTDSEKDAR